MTTSPGDAARPTQTLTDLIRIASTRGDECDLHDRLIREAREVVSRAKR